MKPSDVKQLLINAGISPNSLMFALAQACFESGGITFTSAVNIESNNLTGIEFLNAPFQKNAVAGSPMPLADTGGKLCHYAKFATLQDWANDFKRIVHAQFAQNQDGRPIDAATLGEYVHRLKLNGYFGGPEDQYLEGLTRYLNELKTMGV